MTAEIRVKDLVGEWTCPFTKQPCTHLKGYPSVDIGESRMQVCIACRINELTRTIEKLISTVELPVNE